MSRYSLKERMLRSLALRKGEVRMRADFERMGSPSQISRVLKELMSGLVATDLSMTIGWFVISTMCMPSWQALSIKTVT